MAVLPFQAGNKEQYDESMAVAEAQHRVVNKAYIEYHKAAQELSRLWDSYGQEIPVRGTPEHKLYLVAEDKKKQAYSVWQREAHKHGAMFIDLKRPAPVKEETVW